MIVAEDFGEITQIRMGRRYALTRYTSIGKIVPKGKAAIKACLDYLKSIGLEAGRLHCEDNLTKQQTPQEE